MRPELEGNIMGYNNVFFFVYYFSWSFIEALYKSLLTIARTSSDGIRSAWLIIFISSHSCK